MSKNNVYIQDNEGRTALHVAVQKGNYDIVQRLAFGSTAINIRDNEGQTAFHLAVGDESMDIIQRLIPRSNVNIQDNEGRTALHLAMVNRSIGIIQYLLHNGAKVNKKDVDGWILCLAGESGRKVTEDILKYGGFDLKGESGQQLLKTATENQWKSVLKTLVEEGVDVQTENGSQLMSMALKCGWDELVVMLVNRGIQLSAGAKAVKWALEHERYDVLRQLLRKIDDINLKMPDGSPAFVYAVHRGAKAMEPVLSEIKKMLMSGMELAIECDDVGVVRQLLEFRIPVDNTYPGSGTALHRAVAKGCQDMVELLVQKITGNGDNINEEDDEQRTALDIAESEGYEEIVNLLEKHGGVSGSETSGETA